MKTEGNNHRDLIAQKRIDILEAKVAELSKLVAQLAKSVRIQLENIHALNQTEEG